MTKRRLPQIGFLTLAALALTVQALGQPLQFNKTGPWAARPGRCTALSELYRCTDCDTWVYFCGSDGLTWTALSPVVKTTATGASTMGAVPSSASPTIFGVSPTHEFTGTADSPDPVVTLRGSNFDAPMLASLYDNGSYTTPVSADSGDNIFRFGHYAYTPGGWKLAAATRVDVADTPTMTGAPGLYDIDLYDSDNNKVTVFGARFWTGASPAAQVQIGPNVTFFTGYITLGDGRVGQPSRVAVVSGKTQGTNPLLEFRGPQTALPVSYPVYSSVSSDGSFVNASIAFADLGAPANGRQYYCSDCGVGASNACAAAGSGAMAFRVGAAWKCLQ